MNDVIVHLIDQALRQGLLSIEQLDHSGTFALKTHVMGLTFTLSKLTVSLETRQPAQETTR